MTELRDSAIWAATCDLKAQVLPNEGRPLLVRSAVPGLVLVAVGLVALAVAPAVVGLLVVAVGIVAVLPGLVAARAPGHLMLEADGFTYRLVGGRVVSLPWEACGPFRAVRSVRSGGHVAWQAPDGGRGGALLPGAAGLPAEDLAVLLERYRERFAPATGGTGGSGGPAGSGGTDGRVGDETGEEPAAGAGD